MAREAASSLPAAQRGQGLRPQDAPQAGRRPLPWGMAGDCPAASVLLAFAEATISAPFSRAPAHWAAAGRRGTRVAGGNAYCVCMSFAPMPHGRGLPNGERPSLRPSHVLRPPGRARAAPPRDPPARVAREGSGGWDALLAPVPCAGRGRCRRGPAKRRPWEVARQTLRVCKSAPFSLPVVGLAPDRPVACRGLVGRIPGLGRLKVNNAISRHPTSPSVLAVGSAAGRSERAPSNSSASAPRVLGRGELRCGVGGK